MITFTRTVQSYNEATAVTSPVVTSISGNAVEVPADPEVFLPLGLTSSQVMKLIFIPQPYMVDRVKAGDVTVWAGETVMVKDAVHVAPDGVVVLSKLHVAR
ncbi:MAG TPA: hypothetical protein VK681_39335 [Reyranella sp.]|nr:hypothetical protein [Reyranella sp.]